MYKNLFDHKITYFILDGVTFEDYKIIKLKNERKKF